MADANIVVRLVDQTSSGLGQVNNNLGKIEKSTGRVSKGFKSVGVAVAGFVAALSGKALLDFVSNIQNIENRLKLTTTGMDQLNERFYELVDIANGTRGPLNETVDLFTKLALAGKNVGLNTQEVLQVTENFNKVLAISGASGNEAASAILQFSQAMASGTLRGDEFRSLTEAVPPLLDILARKLNTTRGGLREYSTKGLLNAELVSRALISATEELNATFGKTSVTVGQALTVLSNNFKVYGKETLDATGAGGILSSSILAIADSLEFLIPLLAGGATVALGVLLAAISPLAAGVAAFTLAIGAAYVALKKFGPELDFSGVLISSQKAFLNFKIGALGAIQDFVNGAMSGLGTFKDNTVATFSGIGAAILDPLNAFEAFDRAFDKSKAGIEDGSKSYVNFSASIDAAKTELTDLENQTKKSTIVTDKNTTTVDKNTDGKGNNSDATEDNTDETEDNSDALSENEKKLQEQLKALKAATDKTKDVTNAYGEFTAELERNTELARLDSDAREVQVNVYRALEARAKDLKKSVSELQETETAQITKRVTDLTLLEQKNRDFLTRTKDFTTTTNELIEQNYDETSTKIQQIEKDKQEFIQEARELGKENNADVQTAILEFDRSIAEEQKKINEEKYKDIIAKADEFRKADMNAFEVYNRDRQQLQEALDAGIITSESDRIAILNQLNKDYIEGTTKEYGNLYGFFNDKVMEFTGLTKKEFGILDDVTKLVFGVSIQDTIKGTFASGIQSILGFKNQGTTQLNGMPVAVAPAFGAIGDTIAGTFVKNGLSSVGSFAMGALDLLGGLGKNIFSIFGGVGDFLGNTFGGAFKSISSSIGSLFGGGGGGSGGGGLGGIFGTIGNIIAPGIGGIIGNIFGGFFEEGGYLPAGSYGIVGEAGPELIQGPATITSTKDTADMFNRGSVNVNFTINAVDSQSIDTLLTQRRDLITTMVKNAVDEGFTL